MLSTKGFLERSGGNTAGDLRMTEAQKATVARAVDAALHWFSKQQGTGMIATDFVEARKVVAETLAAYPADRSCATCDFEDYRACVAWSNTPGTSTPIPDDFFEAGCERHQVDGAPF